MELVYRIVFALSAAEWVTKGLPNSIPQNVRLANTVSALILIQ